MEKRKLFINFIAGVFGGLLVLLVYTFSTNQNTNTVKQRNNYEQIEQENGFVRKAVDSNQSGTINSRTAGLSSPVGMLENEMVSAAQKTVDAVVHVKTAYVQQYSYGNPFLEYFFGQGSQRKSQPVVGSGSGVIISDDGYIVTNNHVIDKAQKIKVVLNDKREFDAELVGSDPGTDIALLKIDENNLPHVKAANSDNVQIGEWVLAVGNPFNLTSTVTAGIVSAKARNINILRDQQYPIESYIQTDAAVNKGNSGGALVNMKSELVGINSAILSPSGAYSGYSFAIPVNIVRKVVSDIIKYGEVQRAVLGVEIRDINKELVEKHNLDKIEGVFIANVTDDGAAKEAGLKSGDVILEINDVKINSVAELTGQIGRYRPGEKVNITIKRANKKKQIDVILRNMHGTTKIIKADEYLAILGADFQKLSTSDQRRLGIETGVKVVDLMNEGALKKAGVKEGFVITYIQGKKIAHVDDIKRVIRNIGYGVEIEIEGMYPGGRYIYVYRVELE